jgi:hypothetical protein
MNLVKTLYFEAIGAAGWSYRWIAGREKRKVKAGVALQQIEGKGAAAAGVTGSSDDM